MKQKKVPMRMCVGCKSTKPKKELIRVVKNKENDIFIDFTGKKNGRGAYICHNSACLDNAIKTKRLEKTIRGCCARSKAKSTWQRVFLFYLY